MWFKKHWEIVAMVVGSLFALLLLGSREMSFANNYKQIKETHDEELRKIQKAREVEREQHLVNEKKLKDTLVIVQKEYDQAQLKLDSKKKKEVEKIVSEFGHNPNELANKLSEATNFKIILPTE